MIVHLNIGQPTVAGERTAASMYQIFYGGMGAVSFWLRIRFVSFKTG